MKYFEWLTDEVEIKARYKELAKSNHPDKGGCLETMKEINRQYDEVMTGTYQRAGKSITEIEELLMKDALLRGALDQILQYDDLIVEICGRWIWVTGNTKVCKEALKQAKFMWANQKKAWYWRLPEDRSFNRKKMSMEEIRASHGTQQLRSSGYREKIA